ncbi:MAG: TonB family protein [Chlorobiaceae bacterium]|nr:TonB family protein [Chlorobiaceae bacterium]
MSTRDELKKGQREFSFWIGVAAAGHVAVIIAVVLLQVLYVRLHPPVKIVNVSLVSLPGLPGPAGGPKIPAAPAEVKKAAEPSPAPPKQAAVKKVPEPTPPQQKKAPEPVVAKKVPVPVVPPKKVPDPVVPKKLPEPVVAKKVPESVVPKKEVPTDAAKQRQQNLDAAIDRLKNKTETQKPAAKPAASDVSDLSSSMANLQKKITTQGGGGPASMGAGRGGGGGAYGTGGGAVDAYKAKIKEIVSGNWVTPSRALLRKLNGMEVIVRIWIMPDGSIGERKYIRPAPSEFMNNSVVQTLNKSVPFPPPPKEYGPRGVVYDLNFTPEDLVVK